MNTAQEQRIHYKKWGVALQIFLTLSMTWFLLLHWSGTPDVLVRQRISLKPMHHTWNTGNVTNKSTQNKNTSYKSRTPSQTWFRSWTKGVVTQLHPAVKKNCTNLMAGDEAEIIHVAEAMSSWRSNNSYEDFLIEISDCYKLQEEFHNSFYVSAEEKDFPIAYILVVYTNPKQIVRFLKAVYRPQNVYCIHPDLRSGKGFSEVFHLLSTCFKNIFVASHIQEVHYARSDIFEAQLSCYRDLDKYPADKWYYVINLCGQELPLKTNHEIVDDLRAMDGTSIIKPHPIDDNTLCERFLKKQRNNYKNVTHDRPIYMNETLGEPPFDIKLYKSSSYNALSRVFVHFILHNQTVQTFMQWIKHAWVPEEHFYASVYMMPGSPGGHSSLHPIKSQALVSKVIWKHNQHSPYYSPSERCAGRSVHQICILTSAELPRVKDALKWNMWFFNKYFMEDDHVIMDCVEEVLVRKNIEEFHQDNTTT